MGKLQETKDEVDLRAGVQHARAGPRGPEVSGYDSADIEGRGQQRLDDGELVVRLVLGVGVDDEAVAWRVHGMFLFRGAERSIAARARRSAPSCGTFGRRSRRRVGRTR